MSSLKEFKEVSTKQIETVKEIKNETLEITEQLEKIRCEINKLSIETDIPDELRFKINDLMSMETDQQNKLYEIKTYKLDKLFEEASLLKSELNSNIEGTQKFVGEEFKEVDEEARDNLEELKRILKESESTDRTLDEIKSLIKL
jgi:hypothetical protein